MLIPATNAECDRPWLSFVLLVLIPRLGVAGGFDAWEWEGRALSEGGMARLSVEAAGLAPPAGVATNDLGADLGADPGLLLLLLRVRSSQTTSCCELDCMLEAPELVPELDMWD